MVYMCFKIIWLKHQIDVTMHNSIKCGKRAHERTQTSFKDGDYHTQRLFSHSFTGIDRSLRQNKIYQNEHEKLHGFKERFIEYCNAK